MVRRKENKKFNLIKLIGLLLFACGMFMIVYNYSTKVKLDENNDTKIEDFFDDDNKFLINDPLSTRIYRLNSVQREALIAFLNTID